MSPEEVAEIRAVLAAEADKCFEKRIMDKIDVENWAEHREISRVEYLLVARMMFRAGFADGVVYAGSPESEDKK